MCHLFYGTLTVVSPGALICITPPHIHISFELLFNAGKFAKSTVGEPGTQGAEMAGIHGIGVNTPSAAAVAEATVGFAIELHIPKGRIFTNGTLSIIFAAGIVLITLLLGSTIRQDGAAPKLHWSCAPPQTKKPIIIPMPQNRNALGNFVAHGLGSSFIHFYFFNCSPRCFGLLFQYVARSSLFY